MKDNILLVRISKNIRRKPLKFIAIGLVTVYTICMSVVMITERCSFFQAMLILLPSFFGELGDITPSPKDIVSIISLAIYVLFLGLIFGKLSEILMTITLRGGVFMKRVKYENHIVLCGWNYQAPSIINNLLSDDYHHEQQIVVLADLETIPYDSDYVDFIRGIPWRRDDLEKASMSKANTAIVLTDICGEKNDNPDAEALMITLAIESLNRDVHTCVQLLNSENRIHLENAHADEIICLDQTGGQLAVSSALNHGVSSIINELLTFSKGSEFYKYEKPLPEKYIGITFADAVKHFIDMKMVLIAIGTRGDDYAKKVCSNDWIHSSVGDRIIIINPQGEYRLRQGDMLFVVSEKEPESI